MAKLRSYSVSFNNVSVGAVQDLIALYCGTSQAVEVHGFVLGQVTGTTVANLRISLKRLPATVTPGSGGTTPTPQKLERGDAASTINAAHVNDTTPATTGGTAALLHEDIFNTVNGYQFFFPPNDIPSFGLSEAAVLSLDQAPGSALVMNGTLYFAERV